MSSAALQTAPPHQPTALSSSLPSPSNRQYTQPHSSPNREIHNAHQSASTPPSSRRPPSRKSSGHGASVPSDSSAPLNSRIPTSATRAVDKTDRLSSAPAAPPRTSSNNPDAGQARGHNPSDKMNNSPRRGQADGSRIASRGDTNGSADHARAKRAHNYHPPQDSAAAQVPSSAARGGGHAPAEQQPPSSIPIPIRTHQTATNSKGSREASESLHRVISNGEEANGRGAYHNIAAHDVDPAAPPPVVPMNAASDDRRGGRSRHDHSRNTKATTKFGDFILGNTIGEGEFGKVKLGWKQDSSVQVSLCFSLTRYQS